MTVPAGCGEAGTSGRYNEIPAVPSCVNPPRPPSREPSRVVNTPSTATRLPSSNVRTEAMGDTVVGGDAEIVGVGVGAREGVGVGSVVGTGDGTVVEEGDEDAVGG